MSSGNTPSEPRWLDLEAPVPGTWALCGSILAVHLVGGFVGWWSGFETAGQAWIWTRPDRLRIALGGQDLGMLEAGDSWQLWTSVLVHTDALHLGANLVAIYALGRLLEPMLGARRLWSWFWVGGVLASLASWRAGVVQSDGASGGAFALLGAALVIGGRIRRELVPEDARLVGPVLWGFTALNLVLSVALPFVDAVAHLAGLGVGLVLGALLGQTRWWAVRWLEWLTLGITAVLLWIGWFDSDLFRMWYWRPWLASHGWLVR